VAASPAAAIAIGIPVGVLAARRPRLGAPIVWLANVVQTIPSLAMFGFLLPLPLVGGLGARVAIVVLILYALLPIIRTTVAGVRGVDRVLVEAGTALGMTSRQLLWQVELPLAMPSMVAGIRVAAVIGVGTATIAAAVGAGDIDVYVEYTGTADTAVFKNPVETDPAKVLERVRRRYADGGLTLMPPLGFENTFAILVRGEDARRLGLKTIDDTAAHAPK